MSDEQYAEVLEIAERLIDYVNDCYEALENKDYNKAYRYLKAADTEAPSLSIRLHNWAHEHFEL